MSKIIENLTSSKKRSRSPASSTSNTKKSNAAKNSTRVSKPAQAGQFDPTSIKGESTVIYLGHIPTGFGEAESRKFFAQFGKVRRVKIFKSMKTGGSKGYGFVQFETPDVATVVAEAMDGYFLSDRQLVCHVIPVNKLHEGMFLPPKQKSKPVVKDSEGADEKEATDDEDEEEETAPSQEKIERLTRTQAKKQKRLKDLGIDYDF